LKVATEIADHKLLGSEHLYDMGDPEPAAFLRVTEIERKQISRIDGTHACNLLRIGI
jgi:hypothetical protein